MRPRIGSEPALAVGTDSSTCRSEKKPGPKRELDVLEYEALVAPDLDGRVHDAVEPVELGDAPR